MLHAKRYLGVVVRVMLCILLRLFQKLSFVRNENAKTKPHATLTTKNAYFSHWKRTNNINFKTP